MPQNFKSGTYTGDTAAQNISLGFTPTKIEVWNVTDGDEGWEWFTGMTDGHARKIAADGTQTRITSNGISMYAGSATAAKGFTIGTALSESAKVFRWTAESDSF